MATEEELERGFRAAHAHGDKANAQRFADEIRRLRSEDVMPTPAEAAGRTLLEGTREAIGQGVLAGSGDEIEAGIGSMFTDQSYDEYHGDLESSRAKYREKHPAASTVANLGGAVLSPMNKTVKGGKLVKALAETGKGIFTGGMSADADERGEGAAIGGGFSAGLNVIGQGGRALTDSVAAKRIKEAMTDGAGNFIPLNMLDESALGQFYRTIVAKAYGGKAVIDQSKAVLKNQESVETGLVNTRNKIIRNEKVRLKTKRDVVSDTATAEKRQLGDAADASIREIDDDVALQLAEQEARAAASGSVANKDFVSGNFRASMPDWAGSDVIVANSTTDPQTALGMMQKLWNKEGFKQVKSKKFVVDVNKLYNQIHRKLNKPGLSDALPAVDDVFDRMSIKVKGNMKGSELMTSRNDLRQAARRLADEGKGAQVTYALNKAADDIDKLILSQLDKAGKKEFRKQIVAYNSFINTRRAVGESGVMKDGFFDPVDYLRAQKRSSGRQFATGSVPGQSGASGARVANEQGKQGLDRTVADIQSGARDARDVVKTTAEQQKRQVADAATTQKRALTQALDSENLATKVDPQFDESLRLTKEKTERMKGYMPKKSGGPIEPLIATGVLGLGVGVTNFASGSVLARALSTQGVQKSLAGHTNAQVQLREVLKRYDAGEKKILLDNLTSASKRALIQLGILEEE